ncbi:Tat pathway signal protein [Streptomyces sp. NPDC060065]|uniref:Tat pathway signal protein n=1 Tax=Streptomyces sp. NPDC060065 TaxID=3347050 RepID=UPI00369F5B2A
MPEHLQRRSLLKATFGTVGAVTAGWLWQAGPAQAVDATTGGGATGHAGALDTLVFGDTASETAHRLTANLSDVIGGGLDQSARVLNPKESASAWGGKLAVTMACRPKGPTYVTVKLWGSDSGVDLGRLQLFAEGKQVGHYHLGAVDPLDIADVDGRSTGRFYFHTLPLPSELTAGRTSVSLEVRSMGWIPVYAQTADDYYRAMTRPTRGIYRLYTHDEPYFELTQDEVTGTLPATPEVRTSPGTEVLDAIESRVLAQVTSEVNRTSPQLSIWYLDFLARAYLMPSTSAYKNKAVPLQMVNSLDAIYWRYITDPTLIEASSPQQWMGFGRVGQFLMQMQDELTPLLDEPVIGSPGTIANPGFEYGTAFPTGWRGNTWTGAGTASRDATVSHGGGTASAKITIPSAGVVGLFPAARITVDQGTYTYGAWVREEGTAAQGAYLDVLFFDAAGKLVGGDNKYFASGGTHDWEQVTATLPTPAAATQIEVQVRLQGAGTAWFDDLTLQAPSGASNPPVIRRAAWAKMLLDSREYWRQNIPQYTNQAMICAIGLYLADRGLTVLGSNDAWGEEKARGHLYQAVGLSPWLGPEDASGNPTKPLGSSYYQVTKKGITKELGFAGNYGEVQAWLAKVYEAVTVFGGVSDSKLRDHLIKIVKARGVFRHPGLDTDGFKTMRYEAVIGWRDPLYPGKVTYDQDLSWDGHPMQFAALVKDPDLLAYARQQADNNQLFPVLKEAYDRGPSDRMNLNLLTTAGDYATVTGSTGGALLPMAPGRPDFVFSDEENGLVAIKHGDEILYASLYWRARWGVNRLARVHHITPAGTERSATVWQDVKYIPDGRAYTEPDWVNWEFGVPDLAIPGGGFPPPGDTLHQAFAGQVLPLAKAPSGVPDSPLGHETPFVGRASFYRCQYGPYLIAMNTTTDRTYTFTTQGFGASRNLVTGAKVSGNAEIRVKPSTTVVLRKR